MFLNNIGIKAAAEATGQVVPVLLEVNPKVKSKYPGGRKLL
ncbi:MAG: hypothetical protein AAF734_04885 [Bacteroidota bacterium]